MRPEVEDLIRSNADKFCYHPKMLHMNVRPVVAEFVCVIVNVSLATVETYILPLALSAAAFAVVGSRCTFDPGAIMPD